MLPSLQPSRPKPPQQPGVPTLNHQQRRAPHTTPSQPQPQPQPQPQYHPPAAARPRSQIEAMPPRAPRPTSLFPPQSFYDSAVRHPVFFTENLRKLPFPIPNMASHGWSPVASGYISEQGRVEGSGRTKL